MIKMRNIRILVKNIRDGLKNVVRNFSLSLASISCITVTLLIVAVAMIGSLNVENFTNIIRDDFTIVVYMDNSLDSLAEGKIKSNIQKLSNIESIELNTKDAIANQMKEEAAISNQSSYICEMIGKNSKINPIFFQIYSKDSGKKDEIYLVDEIFFKQFVLSEEVFSFVDKKEESEAEFKKMKELCKNNRQLEIIDFDDHLENPNLDWRNTFIDY